MRTPPMHSQALPCSDVGQQKAPDVPFVFISAAMGEERAIDSLKRGATDYVLQQRLSRLAHVVRRALQEKEERLRRRRVEEALQESEQKLRSMRLQMMDESPCKGCSWYLHGA